MQKTAFVTRLNSTVPTPTRTGAIYFNNKFKAVCTDCDKTTPILYGFASKKAPNQPIKWLSLLCSDCHAESYSGIGA